LGDFVLIFELLDISFSNANAHVTRVFAGSSTFTVANPIGAVLDAFGVTIDGE